MKTLAIPLHTTTCGHKNTHVMLQLAYRINTHSCVAIGLMHNYHFVLYFEVISFSYYVTCNYIVLINPISRPCQNTASNVTKYWLPLAAADFEGK